MTRGGPRAGSGSQPQAEVRRRYRIPVLLSPAEEAELLDYAAAANKPLATYLRDEGLAAGRGRKT